MIQKTYKFEVKDNILKSALFGSYTCNENKVKVNGYFNHDEYSSLKSKLIKFRIFGGSYESSRKYFENVLPFTNKREDEKS